MDNNFTDVVKQIKDLEKRVIFLEKKLETSDQNIQESNKEKQLSLREFLLEKKPSNDVERTLAIGYFLEKYENIGSFNVEDILNAYVRAKEKKPQNINDKINMNIKKGHIDEDRVKKGGKKSWYLTNSGEIFVDNNFTTT